MDVTSGFLQLSATLNKGQVLWAHDPQTVASSTSYTIGMNLGGVVDSDGGKLTGGISASQTFKKNTLCISDYSDPGERLFKINYNYDDYNWRWNWDPFGKYMYKYTEQKAAFAYKTKESKYSFNLVHKMSYDLWDSKPGYWAGKYFNKYSTVNKKIKIKVAF